MAKLNVNPTRMELGKLKKRLSTAKRGHKLLEDKQDELMRQFIILIRKNNELRKKVEERLINAMRAFSLANTSIPEAFLQELVTAPTTGVELEIGKKNVMSVNVPVMTFKYDESAGTDEAHYGYLQSNGEMDMAIEELMAALPLLLELTEIEKACQLLAAEIERTRRRVNALEYMTIPQLVETIKYIQMKLEENERASITRLMKIKDMGEKKKEALLAEAAKAM